MTEEQAKTKWCPMVRVASSRDPGAAAINTPIERRKVSVASGKWCNCIASACMMWRWTEDQSAMPAEERPQRTAGFCGLAGKWGSE